MLCLSHRETLGVVDQTSAAVDIKMKEWVNKVPINGKKNINVIPTFQLTIGTTIHILALQLLLITK